MGKIRKLALYFVTLAVLLSLFACNKKDESDLNTTVKDTLIYQEEEETLPDTLVTEAIVEEIDTPKLSIIIDDMGNYNNFMLDSLLVKFGELPLEVSFAILPNLPYSEFVMEYFQFDKRELLLHAPLQPQNSKINAGQVVINSDDDPITVINKLNDFYAKLPNIKGINNHMGSKTTENPDVMTTILEWCQANNLYFVDSATTAKSVGFKIAQELGVPTAKRDIFLDVPNPTKATVDNYLGKMKRFFEADKDILVITHASSLERRDNLQYFIDEAERIGFKLVPLSEYVSSKEKAI
jgi:polysaccharide deacetylase 2 family uncharacterized protein YibQ